MYKIWCWSFFMLSSTIVQIWIKYYISCFMYYLLSTTQKVEKITEFVSESIPKFISIIWKNVGWIWGLSFMNLNKLDVKNKNINLYCIFYVLFIRNQRKNWLPNKYRFRPFSSLLGGTDPNGVPGPTCGGEFGVVREGWVENSSSSRGARGMALAARQTRSGATGRSQLNLMKASGPGTRVSGR
jgi:hypothetical protein